MWLTPIWQAINFDSLATVCPAAAHCGCRLHVDGCTQRASPNYNPAATRDDGGCEPPRRRAASTGDVAVRQRTHRPRGCTDPAASNFRSGALDDDGSCRLAGCMEPAAENYAQRAVVPTVCRRPPPPHPFQAGGRPARRHAQAKRCHASPSAPFFMRTASPHSTPHSNP